MLSTCTQDFCARQTSCASILWFSCPELQPMIDIMILPNSSTTNPLLPIPTSRIVWRRHDMKPRRVPTPVVVIAIVHIIRAVIVPALNHIERCARSRIQLLCNQRLTRIDQVRWRRWSVPSRLGCATRHSQVVKRAFIVVVLFANDNGGCQTSNTWTIVRDLGM